MDAWPRTIVPFEEEAASSWVDRVCRTFHCSWDGIMTLWCPHLLSDAELDIGGSSIDLQRVAEAAGLTVPLLREMLLIGQFPAMHKALDPGAGYAAERLGWEPWRPLGRPKLLQLCPACVQEKGTFYYRLPWRFKALRTCNEHKCWLLPACQAGEQAQFRGDANGCLAQALALDDLSRRALVAGEVKLSNMTVSAELWFSTLLPTLAIQLEGNHYPRRHPALRRLCIESARLGRVFVG